MADIWSGVNFGNSIINPGSVFQSYNPNTGQTTYGSPTPGWSGGMSMAGGGQSGPPVSTPTNTPVGAQVYQNAQIGYAPSGPMTNFTTDSRGNVVASPYSQNPNAYPDIKTANLLSNTDFKDNEKASLLESQNNALKAQQEAQNLGSLKDRVLSSYKSNPNGIANNAFIQAAAQAAFGRAATKDELAKGGQFGLQGLSVAEVTKRFGLAPKLEGATDYPPTQVEPAPEIADDQGLIDLEKFQTQLMSELKMYNDQILQAQSNIDTFTNQTQRGVNDIGQQLGRTATLVSGEQLALKQQRQADEDMLVKRLGIATQAKGFAVESMNMRMQIEQKIYDRKREIVQDARQLRKDQQDAFAATFDLMLKSGMAKGSMDKATMDFISKQSKMTGTPMSLYVNALDAAYNDKLNSNIEMIKTNKGRNNYLTRIDKTTGKIISETFIGSDPAPSGGGGNSNPFDNVYLPNGRKYSDYIDDLAISIGKLSEDKSKWQQQWDYMQTTYGVDTGTLWNDLGKDKFAPNANEKVSTYNKVSNWWNNTGIPAKKKQGKSALSR